MLFQLFILDNERGFENLQSRALGKAWLKRFRCEEWNGSESNLQAISGGEGLRSAVEHIAIKLKYIQQPSSTNLASQRGRQRAAREVHSTTQRKLKA
jgi:hypothetical protein